MTPTSSSSGAPRGPGVDASSDYRLSYAVEPRRYELLIAPNLEEAVFDGEVSISAMVTEPVREVVLHAVELEISDVTLTSTLGPVSVADHILDEAQERLKIRLDDDLPLGECVIEARFTGRLNDELHGFYRSTFTAVDGSTKTIATTQFEATDARRAFPCFDEPDRKAVFSITLEVPEEMAAFSNGPVTSETVLDNGRRRVSFGDTIPMSTYLVAFVVGPLDATEPVDVNGTALRVIHVPGKSGLTPFALEIGAHALRFFTGWFGIPYPGSKLDLVAIPDFAFGAMENLGCVTFRESLLLVDPARASRVELERIADVVAHEIAHMWFGDLVTMKWWNGIWLNEAFATLMELLCVDAFRPEWQRWVTFGIEREAAFATDALHSTRPVEYPVGPPEEAQGMFDVLTYQKGASVLRMLQTYLGPEHFRDGIRRYLDAHRLGNTDTADLWEALESATNEPVGRIMDTWILQGGFPLVSVATSRDGISLELSQEPFTYAKAEGTSAVGQTWQVPVLVREVGGSGETQRVLLDDGPRALRAIGGGTSVLNAEGSGFYRVKYSAAHVRRLADEFAALQALERFNLLADTWASVVAGRSQVDDFFVLAESLESETDPDVWAQVIGALSLLDHAVTDEVRPRLAEYARVLAGPPFEMVGWAPRPGEADRTGTLRAHLLGLLGTVGQDKAIREECERRHREASNGGDALDPDLASAIVGVIAAAGNPEDYEVFLERYRHPTTPQEEMRYLYSLAGFPEESLAARTFDLAMNEVRTQNAPFLIQLLLSHRDTGAATWNRVRDNWDAVVSRTPAN
ncbi:MAG TPA: M1 family metallopeptidase, partial [Acidimicrobiales bacterium]|nr:M1 family metallopeptidase [Acidimicrobiales bacterium]